jgi:hypothetical protein
MGIAVGPPPGSADETAGEFAREWFIFGSGVPLMPTLPPPESYPCSCGHPFLRFGGSP